ncbi:MAG: hypothetical protein GY791_10730 [Alphaproteobacteria bacterium]|nr:hypothetical protein [Alphaproteobacteria bacterium]
MTKRRFGIAGLVGALLLLAFPLCATAENGTPPFLYVVVADEGEIRKHGEDYVISLEKDDIDHVLEIGESPFKLENYISADRIESTWKEGAGNFGPGVTMKGTILSEDGAIPGINIRSISKTADEMVLVFFLDNNAPIDSRLLGEIEDVTIVNYCCHPTGGSGEWLWGER